jgi:hypothetical protein
LSRIVWMPRSFSDESQRIDSILKGASAFKISTISSRKVDLPDPGGPVIKICGRSAIISRIELNTVSWPYRRVAIKYLVLAGLRSYNLYVPHG